MCASDIHNYLKSHNYIKTLINDSEITCDVTIDMVETVSKNSNTMY